MTDTNFEPEVEFWREEQRQQERIIDEIAFEPWVPMDDPDTADLPGDENDSTD